MTDCLDCGGRGIISNATEDIQCDACNGTGNKSGRGKAATPDTKGVAGSGVGDGTSGGVEKQSA